MTYTEALSYINSRRKFQKSSSHERIRALLHELGDPHKNMDFVHVVGTNGKGTVCTCLSEILKTAGYKTGLFTSPYIVKFEERIRVDGEFISETDLCRITELVKQKTEIIEQRGLYPTVFETTLAVALKYYEQCSCDIVVLEAGIGGKKDSTNVIDKALVSVFTSISLDHTDVLGSTTEEIAKEKSGIIKEGTRAVCYPLSDGELFPSQDENALAVIKQVCDEKNVPITLPDTENVKILKRDALSTVFTFQGEEYETTLWGKHQVGNLLTAICSAKELLKQGYNISEDDIRKGICNLTMPARTEVIGSSPIVVIDGGHNENAMQSLKESIRLYLKNKKITLVCAFMKDKDYESSLGIISPLCSNIIFTQTDMLRGETADRLAECVSDFDGSIYKCDSAENAFTKALEITDKDDAVVVCGSFYLASEIRNFNR